MTICKACQDIELCIHDYPKYLKDQTLTGYLDIFLCDLNKIKEMYGFLQNTQTYYNKENKLILWQINGDRDWYTIGMNHSLELFQNGGGFMQGVCSKCCNNKAKWSYGSTIEKAIAKFKNNIRGYQYE